MRKRNGVRFVCATLAAGLLLLAAGSTAFGGGDIDDKATRLRQRLGPYCRDFDFYYRHSFARGEMRPVRCSRSGRERTVVIAYAFSDRATRDAWLSEWGRIAKERRTPVIKGRSFTVEVLVRRYEDEVRRELRE